MSNTQTRFFKPGDRVSVTMYEYGKLHHVEGTVMNHGFFYGFKELRYIVKIEHKSKGSIYPKFRQSELTLIERKKEEDKYYLFVDKFDGRWFYGNVVFTTETNILVRKDNGEETLIVKDRFQLFQKVSL